MTTRDPRTGRYVRTANTPESGEGKFPTYTDMPVEDVSGAPSANTIDRPRYAPDDELAQGGESRLRPRHPVLIDADEQARTLYGVQGGRVRDAARLQGLDGMAGHVLGLYPPAAPSTGTLESNDGVPRPRTARRLPSMYQRPDVDQGVNAERREA